MTQRRTARKGSFGAHLDEVVKHFPADALPQSERPNRDVRERQEHRDIHALLFEKAWGIDGKSR